MPAKVIIQPVGLLGTLLTLSACAGSSGPRPMPAPTTPPEPRAPEVVLEAAPSNPALDTVQAGEFDNGKMWTFEYPPLDYLGETYAFSADASWFEKARLGALRIEGCTASFVSPNGLVMTNHHCARDQIEQVSGDGEDLLLDGFYALSLEEERHIEGFWADQLIEIRDVTDRVHGALEGLEGTEVRAEQRERVTEAIVEEVVEEFGGEDSGYNVEMVELYSGGRYSVYIFRRYTDLRLVMSPERLLAHFGGDPDNFTYPRYDLDMTFLRVYDESGEPFQPEAFFLVDPEGADQGELIFVIGNPGNTTRLHTVAQLEFRRDFSDRALRDLYRTRTPALQEFLEDHPEEARELDIRNTVFNNLNALKSLTGSVAGLHDPVIMAKRRDNERKLQAAIDADPELKDRYGGLISRMAELQELKREVAPAQGAFLGLLDPTFGSVTLGRGWSAFEYLALRMQEAPQEVIDQVRENLLSRPHQPREIDEAQLAQRFHDLVRNLGPDHPLVEEVLGGRTPEGLAAVIMEGTVLVDSAAAETALATGNLEMNDPAVRVARAIYRPYFAFAERWTAVEAEEAEIQASLGRAFFEVYGTDVPPDATFSLRIADGVVAGYDYNGTRAPAVTTFYGMYDRFHSFGRGTEWDLPDRWVNVSPELDLSTPLNFVCTADIIGGNSGSPVIDRNHRVVGLIFDGNIGSLPGDYIYLPEVNRAVAVDARGIIHALDVMYDADRLVLEMTTGEFARSEAEADTRR